MEKVTEHPLNLTYSTTITVMNTLKRSTDDEYAVSMLVVGTEHKQLYILDHTGSSILHKILLPAIPAFLSIGGFY